MISDFQATFVETVVIVAGNFQVVQHPLFVDCFACKRQQYFGSLVRLQERKYFIQRKRFIFTGTVNFVDHRFARGYVDGAVSDGVDAVVTVDDQRGDIVLSRFLHIVEIGTGRDDVCDIPSDVRGFSFLSDQYDSVAFALDDTVEVAIDRDGGDTGKKGILNRVFQNRFIFSGELNVEQFGDLFCFTDLLFFVIDLIDFEKRADLHQHECIGTVSLFIVTLKIEVDFR